MIRRTTRRSTRPLLAPAFLVALGIGLPIAPAAEPSPATRPANSPATQPATRPVAKAISDQVGQGLQWLAKTQQPDGGWDQGEAAQGGVRDGEPAKSNLADTCVAALAFVRADGDLKDAPHAGTVRKALDFICTQVEKSSHDDLSITDIRTTRLQSKLGTNIDTFAAALLLAEVRGKMPDDAGNRRVAAALDKVLAKIEKHQKEDGRWVDANEGWAAVLCNSVANKAVNRAALAGAKVNDETLVKAQQYAASNLDKAGGKVNADGSAGIELYARAANLQNLQDGDVVNSARQKEIGDKRKDAEGRVAQAQLKLIAPTVDEGGSAQPATPATQAALDQLAQAQEEIAGFDLALGEIKENKANLQVARAAAVRRLDDPAFAAGFGNNGGEEFLSHMNVGESLYAKGGDDFAKWDKAMTDNLNRIQNADGSWSGHHCITGRTFCTSAALLTLMVDRSMTVAVAQ